MHYCFGGEWGRNRICFIAAIFIFVLVFLVSCEAAMYGGVGSRFCAWNGDPGMTTCAARGNTTSSFAQVTRVDCGGALLRLIAW